ncbi:hypothetical protein [Parabacteroides distasonis]|uniref:hypothetical protein n=2 Tax=Parabacteroides distasonis TaxID=823 RepID=UPI003F51C19D
MVQGMDGTGEGKDDVLVQASSEWARTAFRLQPAEDMPCAFDVMDSSFPEQRLFLFPG